MMNALNTHAPTTMIGEIACSDSGEWNQGGELDVLAIGVIAQVYYYATPHLGL